MNFFSVSSGEHIFTIKDEMKGFVLGRFKGFRNIPELNIPFYISKISAGFPSPADDHIHKKLDLNELVIKHPAATFFVRVEGESMRDAGIFHNDILVVDRALTPKNNDIIVCVINGDFAVKRFRRHNGHISLLAENPNYEPIEVAEEMEFQTWGVVTYVFRKT
jgi:DNA polymerase V